MAREIGLDARVAVRAAFVHDIGKAIDREMEGTHLTIGIDFLRKHGESEAVVMAMAAHHMDIDWPSLEAMIVQAADAISAARPGARRDILESYVKRLEKLEGIADSFKGVSKSFALQAGREIRIMVESEKISDEEAVWLSKDIARRIENELEYPGQIKVTVIRETRATDYANSAAAARSFPTAPSESSSRASNDISRRRPTGCWSASVMMQRWSSRSGTASRCSPWTPSSRASISTARSCPPTPSAIGHWQST